MPERWCPDCGNLHGPETACGFAVADLETPARRLGTCPRCRARDVEVLLGVCVTECPDTRADMCYPCVLALPRHSDVQYMDPEERPGLDHGLAAIRQAVEAIEAAGGVPVDIDRGKLPPRAGYGPLPAAHAGEHVFQAHPYYIGVDVGPGRDSGAVTVMRVNEDGTNEVVAHATWPVAKAMEPLDHQWPKPETSPTKALTLDDMRRLWPGRQIHYGKAQTKPLYFTEDELRRLDESLTVIDNCCCDGPNACAYDGAPRAIREAHVIAERAGGAVVVISDALRARFIAAHPPHSTPMVSLSIRTSRGHVELVTEEQAHSWKWHEEQERVKQEMLDVLKGIAGLDAPHRTFFPNDPGPQSGNAIRAVEDAQAKAKIAAAARRHGLTRVEFLAKCKGDPDMFIREVLSAKPCQKCGDLAPVRPVRLVRPGNPYEQWCEPCIEKMMMDELRSIAGLDAPHKPAEPGEWSMRALFDAEHEAAKRRGDVEQLLGHMVAIPAVQAFLAGLRRDALCYGRRPVETEGRHIRVAYEHRTHALTMEPDGGWTYSVTRHHDGHSG